MQHQLSSDAQSLESIQEIGLRIDFVRHEVQMLEGKLSLLKRDVRADIRERNAIELRKKWRKLVTTLTDAATIADSLDTSEPHKNS